jgi:hypothetical protein
VFGHSEVSVFCLFDARYYSVFGGSVFQACKPFLECFGFAEVWHLMVSFVGFHDFVWLCGASLKKRWAIGGVHPAWQIVRLESGLSVRMRTALWLGVV